MTPRCCSAPRPLDSFPSPFRPTTPSLLTSTTSGVFACIFVSYLYSFAELTRSCSFYVQREAFQETTERAVNALFTATSDTAAHLSRFISEAMQMSNSILG